MTVEMTFENVYLFIIYMSDMSDELDGNWEILKRQIATQLFIRDDYKADFWEYVPVHHLHVGHVGWAWWQLRCVRQGVHMCDMWYT